MSIVAFYLKLFTFVWLIVINDAFFPNKRRVEKEKCPVVRSSKSFNFEDILGRWFVIEYFASSEESEIYSCMRTSFSLSEDDVSISMNFTFSFVDDPDNEQLYGNITWKIPDTNRPSHWVHSESIYEGIYNTYVLDLNADGEKSWLLLLHCAGKQGSPRYLSSFILSRRTELPTNAISFLQDKLPQYDVDLQYLFEMRQSDCATRELPSFLQAIKKMIKTSRISQHPMKHAQH